MGIILLSHDCGSLQLTLGLTLYIHKYHTLSYRDFWRNCLPRQLSSLSKFYFFWWLCFAHAIMQRHMRWKTLLPLICEWKWGITFWFSISWGEHYSIINISSISCCNKQLQLLWFFWSSYQVLDSFPWRHRDIRLR